MKCMYVLCRFDQFLREIEHTCIHTYIQTFVSSIRFLHHLKTKILCMFAHACRGNYTTNMENLRVFRTPEISFSTARVTFLNENIKKAWKMNCEMKCRYVWMALFARAGRGKGPIHTYIHGPMPFQRTTIFPCMLTFRRAEWAKGQLHPTKV